MTNEHYIAIACATIFIVCFLWAIKILISSNSKNRKQKINKSTYYVKPTKDSFTVEYGRESDALRVKKKTLKHIKQLKYERLQAELTNKRKKAKELELEINRLEKLIY